MKIIIGYDGSDCAKEALLELQRAGLPANAEAKIVTVTEDWPLPVVAQANSAQVEPINTEDLASTQAQEAQKKLEELFPSWTITTESGSGSASRVLVKKADEWGADLIVVGSHGRSATGRLVFGSISQQVVTTAHCAVHIARYNADRHGEPVRLVLGVDGSGDSEAAIEAVAVRSWPEHTKAWLVSSIGFFYNEEEERGARKEMEEAHRKMEERLNGVGIAAVSVLDNMDPKYALLGTADEIEADCIVVGARGLTVFQRTLLGSVSASVAARAKCSVEVIRKSV